MIFNVFFICLLVILLVCVKSFMNFWLLLERYFKEALLLIIVWSIFSVCLNLIFFFFDIFFLKLIGVFLLNMVLLFKDSLYKIFINGWLIGSFKFFKGVIMIFFF